jgi:hypothetical protein
VGLLESDLSDPSLNVARRPDKRRSPTPTPQQLPETEPTVRLAAHLLANVSTSMAKAVSVSGADLVFEVTVASQLIATIPGR